ncbi:hypothetical protein R3P38DRAFT_609775 [Favolaschia claudopus]|uniref:Uncharacterized protein n=1 Tax=Favolaschia claudopus TaxID=2862362 RepID=A0AAW0C9C4_9AGAR
MASLSFTRYKRTSYIHLHFFLALAFSFLARTYPTYIHTQIRTRTRISPHTELYLHWHHIGIEQHNNNNTNTNTRLFFLVSCLHSFILVHSFSGSFPPRTMRYVSLTTCMLSFFVPFVYSMCIVYIRSRIHSHTHTHLHAAILSFPFFRLVVLNEILFNSSSRHLVFTTRTTSTLLLQLTGKEGSCLGNGIGATLLL